ncbi:MAG TPA: RCC1 domain-containing protein, partial [Candidatus Cloacimonadota bacterium]|nr:RCC1 domain-containing protein [Candidatus Cloacimonadota bacterium]
MKKISIVLLLTVIAVGAFAQGTIVVWGSPHNQVAKNVPSGDDFIGIAAGNAYGIGLRADGSLASWGQANTIVNSTPAGTNFTAISAGDQHAIALREDGSVVGWGNNSFGQTNTPPFTDFVKISAGINHNLGLRA